MGSVGSNGNRNTSTGVPDKMPTLDEVLKTAKSLKGEALDNAITELEWDGDWYREDKRQKKGFVEAVVRNNYVRDPVEGWDIGVAVDSNRTILAAVYGVSKNSKEFNERFDTLYSRRKRKS